MSLFNNKVKKNAFQKYFPFMAISLTLLLGALLWEYYQIRIDELIASKRMRDQSILEFQKRDFNSTINVLFFDLLELSQRSSFQETVTSHALASRKNLEKTLYRFLRNRPFYKRVIVVDGCGHEIINVQLDSDNDVFVTSLDSIGMEQRSVYVDKLLRLDGKTVYIDKLTVETDDELSFDEFSPIPHIKMAVPIVDKSNNNKGLLILTLDGKRILNNFQKNQNIILGREKNVNEYQYLVNNEGYYLYHPNSAYEWGDCFEKREKYNFKDDFQSVSDSVYSSNSGMIINQYGVFSYETFNPIEELRKTVAQFDLNLFVESMTGYDQDHIYKIINYLPRDSYLKRTSPIYNKIIIVFISLFILFVIISWFAATSISNRVYKDDLIKKSEEKLRKANATKDKFIKILAHDLKNPITSIQAFAEIISTEDADFTAKQRNAFSKLIHNSTKGMLQLIDDVLIWSKSQSGDLEVKPTDVDLGDVIDYATSLCDIQAEKKQVSLEKNLLLDTWIHSDANMIVTVIRNLVSNAIKFSYRGEKVLIDMTKVSNVVVVEVIDYGVGIEPSKQKNLFDPGEKKISQGTENEKGTGLGLVLCKEFIHKNNGKLHIKSVYGKGTVVKIALPMIVPERQIKNA